MVVLGVAPSGHGCREPHPGVARLRPSRASILTPFGPSRAGALRLLLCPQNFPDRAVVIPTLALISQWAMSYGNISDDMLGTLFSPNFHST